MEQHPVPRDITGFQFKLVGTMTLKQFGYVASGALIGYVFFKAPIGVFSLPLAGIFWFLGFALAFIPIQERPLDRWLLAFIKSIYSPTQFAWKKMPPEIEILSRPLSSQKKQTTHLSHYQDSRKKLKKYLSTLPLPLEEELDQKENEVLSRALSFFEMPFEQKKPFPPSSPPTKALLQPRAAGLSVGDARQGQPAEGVAPPPFTASPKKPKPIIPPPLKAKKEEEEEKEREEVSKVKEDHTAYEKKLQGKIDHLKKELELKSLSKARFLELSEQLTKALEEKRRLEKEIGALRKTLMEKEEAVVPRVKLEEEEPRVKIITPKLAPKVGIPSVPEAPNIISGIVKDPLGKLLPGMIIAVRNEGGSTVRALKTNNIGLFVSVTSLPNGIYTLEIEDPQKRFNFDIIKVTFGGEIYSPLEISARGEKEKLKEDLTNTNELFS